MDAETTIHLGREALWLVVLLSAPPVGAALVVGLLSGLLQSATQVREDALSVVPRMVAVYVVLVVAGYWALGQWTDFSERLLAAIAEVGRGV